MGMIKFFFIKKNKKIFIALVILGLLSIVTLVSWYIWKNHQANLEYNSLLEYENVMNLISTDQPQTLITAEKFAEDNKNIYGILVSLKVVQHYVSENELQKAADQLQRDLTILKDNNLKEIVGLRLAKIKVKQKKIDQALKVLDSLSGESFFSLIADIRGEALISTGDKKNALHAWESGMKSNLLPVELGEILKIKINNLSI